MEGERLPVTPLFLFTLRAHRGESPAYSLAYMVTTHLLRRISGLKFLDSGGEYQRQATSLRQHFIEIFGKMLSTSLARSRRRRPFPGSSDKIGSENS